MASSAATFLLRVSLPAVGAECKGEGTSGVSTFRSVGSKQAAHLHFMSASRISPLHMLGIDQDHLNFPFEQVEDGSPIDSRTFSGDMGHLQGTQPIEQSKQTGGGRGEGMHLFLNLPIATTVFLCTSRPQQRL